MGVTSSDAAERRFDDFVADTEPRLRRALVATYGPTIGRDAALDALSWAWEHWSRVVELTNPAGYLYRVGRTAAARLLRAGTSAGLPPDPPGDLPEVVPELAAALGGLSEQQRAAVVLVHGYGYSQREAADVLDVAVSTLREHLARGMGRLREQLLVDHREATG